MKKLILSFMAIVMACVAMAQTNRVNLTIKNFEPHNTGVTRAQAEKAIQLANAVLNSKEFTDSLAKYSYPCRNYDNACKQKCHSCDEVIPTQAIVDSLYRIKAWPLDLELNNCGGGVFGETSEDSHIISSCFYTIRDDDDVLPFEYKYAYHLCHEYMHTIGFYHYQSVKKRVRYKDVAESTGWISYYILDRWYREGKQR